MRSSEQKKIVVCRSGITRPEGDVVRWVAMGLDLPVILNASCCGALKWFGNLFPNGFNHLMQRFE